MLRIPPRSQASVARMRCRRVSAKDHSSSTWASTRSGGVPATVVCPADCTATHPSRIGHLLDISLRELEAVLYFESYVVVDPGDAPVKEREVIKDENRFRELDQQYRPTGFKAMMGAEAIKELLKRVNSDELATEMREKMRSETSVQKKLKYSKRLKVVEAFRKSGNKPQWMILDVLPVIPPEIGRASCRERV